MKKGCFNSYTYEKVLKDKSIFDKKKNKELETVILVSTLESLKQCLEINCKRIIFRYNKSTVKEKEDAEKYVKYQYKGNLKILNLVSYICSEQEEREVYINEKIGLENLYIKEEYNYKFVYDMLKTLN